MSRSGYTDDCDNLGLWRGAVARATTGYRGQHLLCKLRDALDAMPVKRLITGAIQDTNGEVCAFGALDTKAPSIDPVDDFGESAQKLSAHFGIAKALAAEIVYLNDEVGDRYEHEDSVDGKWRDGTRGQGRRYHRIDETPEERWIRMRAWVAAQIVPDEPDTVAPKE